MSAFADAVATLGRQGVAVIPTRHDAPSRPLVRHPDKFGVSASAKLAENDKFARANAGVWAGARARLTIVDVDSPDPAALADAISAFGESPLKVQTPSGGWHLYFRHAGETRRIRPFGKSLPLDVLGAGLVAVPPSVRAATGKKKAGVYQVLEGSLTDLGKLPTIRAGAIPDRAGNLAASSQPVEAMREGDGRDNALFAFARNAARACDTLDRLRLMVAAENAKMGEPLPDSIADAKAAQAWRYKLENRLITSGERAAVVDMRAIELTLPYPPALAMLNYLRALHSLGHSFAIVPDAICGVLMMAPRTAQKARDFLLAVELLELIEVGGLTKDGKRPNLYRLKPSCKIYRE